MSPPTPTILGKKRMINILESAGLTVKPMQRSMAVFVIIDPWRGDVGERSLLILRTGMEETR